MNHKSLLYASGLLLLSNIAAIAQSSDAKIIHSLRDDGRLYLNAADVAAALDLELKTVDPRTLITYCRDGDRGFCIPIRLTDSNHRSEGDTLLLAAEILAEALRVRLVAADGKIALEKLAVERSGQVDLANGYNADWGPKRGFEVGQTLPDIPLVDMKGNEIRFSHFLGKRYILYCWASW
jgi:hypothetical protein